MMRQKKVFFVWVNIFSMCIVYVLVLVLEVYPKHSALKSEKMLFWEVALFDASKTKINVSFQTSGTVEKLSRINRATQEVQLFYYCTIFLILEYYVMY